MSIKELYEWARANKAEDYDICKSTGKWSEVIGDPDHSTVIDDVNRTITF